MSDLTAVEQTPLGALPDTTLVAPLASPTVSVRSFLWQSGSSVVALLAGISASFLTARYLGPAAFGVFGLVQWTRITSVMLLDVGLSSATTKFTAELLSEGQVRTALRVARAMFWIQTLIAIPGAIAMLVLAAPIASLLEQPSLAMYLPIAAITLALTLLSGVLSARLVGDRRFGAKTLVDASVAATWLAGVILVMHADGGIAGLTWTEASVAGIQLIALCVLSLDLVTGLPSLKLPPSLNPRIRRYSVGVFMLTVLDAVIWQRSEVLFLAIFRGADDVGYYTIAYGLSVTLITLLPHSLGVVLFPSLSERYGANDRPGLAHLYASSTRHVAIMAMPLCVGGIVLAPEIVRLLYGTDYDSASNVLRVLFVGATAGALATPGSGLLLALDRAGTRSLLAMPMLVVNVALAVILVPALGAFGAAIAKAITQCVHVLGDAVYLLIREQFLVDVYGLVRVAAASLAPGLVATIVISFAHGVVGLTLAIVAGAVAYLMALFSLHAVPDEDLTRLKTVLNAPWLDRFPRVPHANSPHD